MIRNIIFDIGNVLADFRWKEFLQDKGFEGEMLDRIARATVLSDVWPQLDRGVWSEEEVLNGFVAKDPGIAEQIHLAFDDMTGMVTLREYAIPWIQQLKDQGYGVYYLSNFSDKVQRECADSLAFLPMMDGGILSWRDKLIKPDPAIYQLLLSRYGLKPEECVFLDDTPVNVEAGRKEGIAGVVFRTREEAVGAMEALGMKF